MAAKQHYRWEFEIPVPRVLLWRFVSDTQLINRLAGLFEARYEYRPRADGGSEVHGTARKGGLTLRWIEHPGEWIEPEFFRISRDYQAGPLARLVSTVRLEPGKQPGSTHLVQTVEIDPNGMWGAIASRLGSVGTARGFARAYALAPEWAKEQRLPFDDAAWPVAERERLRRQLRALLEKTASALDADAAYERLEEHLLGQPASELVSLAPYALADSWRLPRQEVLRLFLHGAKRGAFDVQYNLICPSCRRSKAVFSALEEVTTTGHCATCNIDFGVDFDRAVEVRFSPAPLGIDAEPVAYCHAGPQNTPHRRASWRLEPGEQTFTVALDAGRHQLFSPECKGAVFCHVVEQGADGVSTGTDSKAPAEEAPAEEALAEASIVCTAEGIHGLPTTIRAGELTLRVDSKLPRPGNLSIVRTAWADDAVSAAEITAMQEFRDLFGSEILAPGAEFAVRNMVFLFSDLVGSTAMYERLGDASAFALVRDHFEVMKTIYVSHGGSLVKTIGDAVMAVFRRPAGALAAALEMHRRIGTLHDATEGAALALRIGLHRGPCIAMEANGLVDYFGTTVNLAARVQGSAGGRETALSPAMLEDEDVRELLAKEAAASHEISVQLKGLSGDHTLTVVGTP